MKVCSALYIPTYEYNYKVITGCDTILQEYYITDRPNCEYKRDIQLWIVKNDAHELQKENSRDEQGVWKDRALDGQLLIHDTTAAQLWSSRSPSWSNVQDLNMQVQGSQNSPTSGVVNAKWRA